MLTLARSRRSYYSSVLPAFAFYPLLRETQIAELCRQSFEYLLVCLLLFRFSAIDASTRSLGTALAFFATVRSSCPLAYHQTFACTNCRCYSYCSFVPPHSFLHAVDVCMLVGGQCGLRFEGDAAMRAQGLVWSLMSLILYTFQLFCPLCQEVYDMVNAHERTKDIDGAYFGPSFPHIFLQTYSSWVRVH